VVFATGATPPKEGYEELIFKTNFRKGESRPAHFYYFLAGINYEKMGFFNRILMKILSGLASKRMAYPNPPSQPRLTWPIATIPRNY